MIIWFLLALGSAISNSWTQVIQKWSVLVSRYSKLSISFVAIATSSLILFLVSYFLVGFPHLQPGFWTAVLITSIINFFTFPLMLKAYEVGEFSSVYSMILLTPVFLLFTSFLFLGEAPSVIGIVGVVLTILGLLMVTRSNHEHAAVPDFKKGNLLGITVALLWSVSVNFDKLAVLHSDQFFAPAIANLFISFGYFVYLLIKQRKLLVKIKLPENSNGNNRFVLSGMLLLFLLGLVMALSNVLHNSALLAGLASYTIAVKRMGVLFGVFWGWLFFKEKNIAKKILGAVIAISGVIAILFS